MAGVACCYTQDAVAVRVAKERLECPGIASVESVAAVTVRPIYELLEVGASDDTIGEPSLEERTPSLPRATAGQELDSMDANVADG